MSSEDTKILEFNQCQKYDKAPFIIYEKSSTAKVSEHTPSGFSMSTISTFKSVENKHDVYRGKDVKIP